MPKPARSSPRKSDDEPKAPAVVVDKRPIEKILPRSQEAGDLTTPIRTIMYVEVQDFPAEQVRNICQQLLKNLPNEHPHYALPLRYGQLTSEMEFEGEFLETVNELCEVDDDGKIVLKGGATSVSVIRKRI